MPRALNRSAATKIWFVGLLFSMGISAAARSQQPQREPVINQNLYFSPYNTYSDGPGPLLVNHVREGSSYAMWVNPGAYLKTGFTGTSATLEIEVTGDDKEQPAKVRWSVDDAPWKMERVPFGKHALTVANELRSGNHSLLLIYAASDENVSRWRQPVAALKIYGVDVDAGAALASPEGSITLLKRNMVFFGDSITEGAWVNGNSNRHIAGKYVDWVDYSDASVAWPRAVAAALGAEYGTCGFGGTGWVTSPNPYVPPLPQSWEFHIDGQTRLDHGKLDPLPDYVIVNMGANDPEGHVPPAVIETWLHEARAAVGLTAAIIVIVPFSGRNRTVIEEAILGAHDPNAHTLDLGARWSYGVSNYGHSSMRSMDGLHLSTEATIEYAAAVAAGIAGIVKQ